MAAYAVGVDVGGTAIRGGVVELSTGRVILKQSIPTEAQRGGEAVLSDVLRMVEGMMAESAGAGTPVDCIGLGVCELVDHGGLITSGQAVPWRGMPVQARLSRLAPAVVEADVRAAALAEARFGAGRPFRLFVYVTVGTGISSCLVQAGIPYAGARGNALVLASSPLSATCPRCGEVFHPVLEAVATGPALVARYNASANVKAARAEDVVSAAERGDPLATEVVRSAGEALGTSVGFLINVLDPEAVVVGGGLGLAGGLYWSSLVSSTRAHVWAEATRNVLILPAQLGTDAGVVGAALAGR